MARPLRIEYPGAVYHVMNRGIARQRVFRGAADYQRFLASLAEAHARWGVEVFAYCLMGTHYHLCIRTPAGNLARVMRHLDGLYTQRFNRAHGRDGPLFRGRYQAILVEEDAYLSAVVRYVHRNPVEARFAATPEDYRWSSHRFYLSPRKVPAWLNPGEVLGAFASTKAFHHFVLIGNEATLTRFYARGRQSPILGGERFQALVRGKVQALGSEHPRYQRQFLRPPVTTILTAVAQEYGVPLATLPQGQRGAANDPRKVAMYLVHRLCDLTLKETGERFRVGSYGVVGWACSEVRHRLARDKEFHARVKGIEARICQQKI